jgi:hypothetical protein
MCQELRSLDADTAKLTASCCDSCRVFVLQALVSQEADLVPCVRGLKQVEQHDLVALAPQNFIESQGFRI